MSDTAEILVRFACNGVVLGLAAAVVVKLTRLVGASIREAQEARAARPELPAARALR